MNVSIIGTGDGGVVMAACLAEHGHEVACVDVDAERARLGKRLEKVETDLARARGKLGNENFVNNAPADVVTQERARAADFEKTITQLNDQIAKLEEFA